MNVQELIDELEQCDPNAEVILLHQPRWPLEYSLDSVHDHAHFLSETGSDEEPENKVFLLEGQQLGYGNKDHFEI